MKYTILYMRKIPAAKNPITKEQVKSKELRHPSGPSLQGFHSKGSSPMPAVSGGEWHAAWIATFGKILVLTLSCWCCKCGFTFSCQGPFGRHLLLLTLLIFINFDKTKTVHCETFNSFNFLWSRYFWFDDAFWRNILATTIFLDDICKDSLKMFQFR